MEKEIILENLDENIVNEATFYNQKNMYKKCGMVLTIPHFSIYY